MGWIYAGMMYASGDAVFVVYLQLVCTVYACEGFAATERTLGLCGFDITLLVFRDSVPGIMGL